MDESANAKAHQHRYYDAGGGIKKSGTARMKDLTEVHAKAERYYRKLQQEFREAFTFYMKRVGRGKSVNKPAKESERRRNEATSRQNKRQEKYVLAQTIHRPSCYGL